jgi:hypothetical protein
MRVRVSEPTATSDLKAHLVEQGFPASEVTEDELDVLFPGRPTIFAPAVELDLWRANHLGVSVTVCDGASGSCS